MSDKMPKRRFLRYSLRTMLVVVLVLSVWLGYHANRAARQREAVALVEELGGYVNYECEVGLIFGNIFVPSIPAPIDVTIDESMVYERPSEGLFYDLLGHDWFHDVIQVSFINSNVTDEQLGEVVDGVPNIKHVVLVSRFITDDSLEHLAKLEQLETALLSGTGVTHAGVARFYGQRPNVRIGCDP